MVDHQSFMLSLNKLNGNDAAERGILITPHKVERSNYKINGLVPNDVNFPDYVLTYNAESYNSLSNYIELTNQCNLKKLLKYYGEHPTVTTDPSTGTTVNDYTITITEDLVVSYLKDQLPTQFPKSTAEAIAAQNPPIGTYMIGYSNISASKDSSAGSHASVNTESDSSFHPRHYYSNPIK